MIFSFGCRRAISRLTVVLTVIGIVILAAVVATASFLRTPSQSTTAFSNSCESTSNVSAQSCTSTRSSCMITGQGWAVYVHVVSDNSSKPVAGAKVSGDGADLCDELNGSSYTYSESIGTLVTPGNGTVSLPPTWTEYRMTVQYSSQTYRFTMSLAPTRILSATECSFRTSERDLVRPHGMRKSSKKNSVDASD